MKFAGSAVAALVCVSSLVAACEPGGSSILDEGPKAPYSELSEVALKEAPKNLVLANYFCRDYVTDLICDFAFDDPPAKKETLKFSFETVFQLGNPNKFSVPMVELLLALSVFEGQKQSELAALCISFCDPAAEDCAEVSADACKAPDKTVRSIEDFVPTIDDLVRVAKQAASGELDDNLKFRVIPARDFQRCRPVGTSCEPCGDSAEAGDPADEADLGTGAPPTTTETICCDDGTDAVTLSPKCHLAENDQGQSCELCDGEVESHVRFDLGIDAITSILAQVAEESVDAISAGEFPSFDIPYTVEGTLFFDVPVLGRFAIGFGPFSSTWSLD